MGQGSYKRLSLPIARVRGSRRYARRMKRHRALIPLSHDHHHALVEARRLRRAADGSDSREAATAFLRFFAIETVRHFREEEELLFPTVVGFAEARESLVQALLEHQHLHALAVRLRERLDGGGAMADIMRELGELLERHIRYEERCLFPLIERLLQDSTLGALGLGRGGPEAGDADGARDHGPVWGTASDDLNATLLSWAAGGGPPEHVNEERDVLVVVLAGSATVVTVDGDERQLDRGEAMIIAKGRTRRITAGPDGVRYLSVHRRRPPLQIGSSAPAHAEAPAPPREEASSHADV